MNKRYREKQMVFQKFRKIIACFLFLAMILSSMLVSAMLANARSTNKEFQLNPIQINFNTYTPTSFGSQDVKPTMTIEDGGNTMHLKGNSWKKLSLPYTVTAYTVLEFDFKSPVQGEAHSIGFDTDQTASSGYAHRLHGTAGFGPNVPFFFYASFAPGWKHYRIPVGQYYPGISMLYMVFINDHDVLNPTGESYFSNVQVFEDPSVPVQPPVDVDFNQYTISPYDVPSQTPALSLTIEDNDDTLHMVGNGWLKISFPYVVTEHTVFEFDYKSSSQGQKQGIGFDTDNSLQGNRTFPLYGTEAGWGLDGFQYAYYAPEWKHFRIPVGKDYTGTMRYIFFANDHDVTNPTSENYFRSLTVYEGDVSLPISVDFNQYAISPYYSPEEGGTFNLSVEDNGSTLHLSGNGWRQISMPIILTQNSVLAFDFLSDSQGEIHAIGLDADLISDTSHVFQLYGTQAYGIPTFND